jgi:hypothetical protein
MPFSWSFQATPVLLLCAAAAVASCSKKVEEPTPAPASNVQKPPPKEEPAAVQPDGKLTRAECDKLFEHFVEVSVSDMLKKKEKEIAAMGEDEKAKAIESLRNVVKKTTDYGQRHSACASEYSREEHNCMMKSTTERGFDACIKMLPAAAPSGSR